MTEQRFAFLHLEGGRFREHPGKIPVECLNEIAIYRRCIASLATDAWRSDHPERERLPKNFWQDFQLSLTGVGIGSALPYLERQSVDLGFDGYFEVARDHFTDLLTRLREGLDAPTGVSKTSLKILKGFGKSFRASETVTLGHPTDAAKRVALDASARVKLRDLDLSAPTIEKDVALMGNIADWNIEGLSFDLRHEGRLVRGATIDTGTDMSAFVRDGKSVPVVVRGKACVDSVGLPLAFASHVTVTDATTLLSYLDRTLGDQPVCHVSEAVVGKIRRWTPHWLKVAPQFGVAILEDIVRIEWQRDGWDCSLEIDGDGGAYAHRYHMDSNKDAEIELESFNSDDLAALVNAWTEGAW